jgi:hypothetical protein
MSEQCFRSLLARRSTVTGGHLYLSFLVYQRATWTFRTMHRKMFPLSKKDMLPRHSFPGAWISLPFYGAEQKHDGPGGPPIDECRFRDRRRRPLRLHLGIFPCHTSSQSGSRDMSYYFRVGIMSIVVCEWHAVAEIVQRIRETQGLSKAQRCCAGDQSFGRGPS